MDIEKIIYLVALAVYGILSIVLSIVRTLKTSKISSEVKSVLPPIDAKQLTDKQPIDDVQVNDDVQANDDVQVKDDVEHGLDDERVASDYDGEFVLSPEEFFALLSKIRESIRERKR